MRGTKGLLAKIDRIISAIGTDIPKAVEDEVIDAGVRAENGFATAQIHGKNDVVVTVDSSSVADGKEFVIDATGEEVLFIEYGTGIKLKHDSQFGDYGLYPPGSWSATHSQYLTDPEKLKKHRGQWPYGGEWIDGDPSYNVMYLTQKNLEINLLQGANSALRKAMK